jgi:hypothetical protein
MFYVFLPFAWPFVEAQYLTKGLLRFPVSFFPSPCLLEPFFINLLNLRLSASNMPFPVRGEMVSLISSW